MFAFFMVNALFVLIVFLLTLKKDYLHIKWPFGVKTNITYDESTQEVIIRGAHDVLWVFCFYPQIPTGIVQAPPVTWLICFFNFLQDRIAKDLIELRNKSVFAFFMFNALFVLVVFLLQLNKDQIHVKWPLGVRTNITYIEETAEVFKGLN